MSDTLVRASADGTGTIAPEYIGLAAPNSLWTGAP
jgi:hypothetical protein